MKRDPKLAHEIADIILKTYDPDETHPLLTHAEDCNFVIYNVDGPEGEASAEKEPTRHLYFAHNHKDSNESNFLEEATYLLDLAIETFVLVVGKHQTQAERYSAIRNAIVRLRSARMLFARLSSLDKPLFDVIPTPGQPSTIYISYKTLPNNQEYSQDIYAAICDFFLIAYLPFGSFQQYELDNAKGRSSGLGARPKKTMFANSGQLLSNQFGMPKPLSDAYNRLGREANIEKAYKQFKETRSARFNASEKENALSLDLDPTMLNVKVAESFAKELIRIKNAKVLQTFCAIWKYANDQDSYKFRGVKISEIMEICLKKGEKTNFSKSERQEFTKTLQYLAALTINLQAAVSQVEKGKKKRGLAVERGVRLFRLREYYALKKEFQNLPDEQLDPDIHYDKTVITKFDGELLPDYNQSFNGIANVYSDVLLQLDANKDQRAVTLGFALQTRFNQNQDKKKPVVLDRGYLIEQCDYQKSDQAKPAVATKQLKNVLEKLKTTGIISGYENLTNNNAEKVSIYPPSSTKSLIVS